MKIFSYEQYSVYVENTDGIPSVDPTGEMFSYRIRNDDYGTTEGVALTLPDAIDTCTSLALSMHGIMLDWEECFEELPDTTLLNFSTNEVSIN